MGDGEQLRELDSSQSLRRGAGASARSNMAKGNSGRRSSRRQRGKGPAVAGSYISKESRSHMLRSAVQVAEETRSSLPNYFTRRLGEPAWKSVLATYVDSVTDENLDYDSMPSQLEGLKPEEMRELVTNMSRDNLDQEEASSLCMMLLMVTPDNELPPNTDPYAIYELAMEAVVDELLEGNVSRDGVLEAFRSVIEDDVSGLESVSTGEIVLGAEPAYSAVEERDLLNDISLGEEEEWRLFIERPEDSEIDLLEQIVEMEPEEKREKIIFISKDHLTGNEVDAFITALASTYDPDWEHHMPKIVNGIRDISPSINGEGIMYHKKTVAEVTNAVFSDTLSSSLMLEIIMKNYDEELDHVTAHRLVEDISWLLPQAYGLPLEPTEDKHYVDADKIYERLAGKMPSINGTGTVFRKSTIAHMAETLGEDDLTPLVLQSLVEASYRNSMNRSTALRYGFDLISAHAEHPRDVNVLYSSFVRVFSRRVKKKKRRAIDRDYVTRFVEDYQYIPDYESQEAETFKNGK